MQCNMIHIHWAHIFTRHPVDHILIIDHKCPHPDTKQNPQHSPLAANTTELANWQSTQTTKFSNLYSRYSLIGDFESALLVK